MTGAASSPWAPLEYLQKPDHRANGGASSITYSRAAAILVAATGGTLQSDGSTRRCHALVSYGYTHKRRTDETEKLFLLG